MLLADNLEKIGITKLPIDPFTIIMENEWNIVTYSIFSEILKMTEREMKEKISYFSFSFYNPSSRSYTFVYNKYLPHRGIIFALAHELGHIYFGDISPKQTFKPLGINIDMEERANEFACLVLGAESKEEFIGPENIF